MLKLKEFEKGLKPVTLEEIFRRKSRGMYLPYVQAIIKKAGLMTPGYSAQIDVQDVKQATALSASIRSYLKKMKMDDYAAGSNKTFVF